MRVLLALFVLFAASVASAQKLVSFPTEDGGLIFADLYGSGSKSPSGERAVVLVHGGQFDKTSWAPQAHILESAGFEVLAIDMRGRGQSKGPGDKDMMSAPLHLDVLAAVRYLHSNGAKAVSVIGASMGGGAAGDASIASKPGEIDRLVFLGAAPYSSADKLKSPSLFLVARDDSNGDGPRLPGIQKQYDLAPDPKRLVVLNGSAHAQFLFQTDQADRVMHEIVSFLTPQ